MYLGYKLLGLTLQPLVLKFVKNNMIHKIQAMIHQMTHAPQQESSGST